MQISLKAARVNRNISQKDLAHKLGVSKSTISRWETGEIKIPDDMLYVYSMLCGVDVANIKIKGKDQDNE